MSIIFRTISMEQGKSVADSWKAVFVESSAKENKVDSLSGKVYSLRTFFIFLTSFTTAP